MPNHAKIAGRYLAFGIAGLAVAAVVAACSGSSSKGGGHGWPVVERLRRPPA